MQKNMNNRFNTEPLVLEIENVVKKGLKTILKDFINRYDLLENTHKQITKKQSKCFRNGLAYLRLNTDHLESMSLG